MSVVSVVICEEYQELVHGKSNYINVGNLFYLNEESMFDLVIQWYDERKIVVEKVLLIDSDDNIMSSFEQEKMIDGYQESVIEYDVKFKNLGTHWICVFDNDTLLSKIPICVESEE